MMWLSTPTKSNGPLTTRVPKPSVLLNRLDSLPELDRTARPAPSNHWPSLVRQAMFSPRSYSMLQLM